MKVETVIFDLDGTLIDSLEIYYKVLAMAFAELGLPIVEREIIIGQLGSGLPNWDVLLPKGTKNKEEIVSKCHQIILGLWPKVYREEADLFEGVPEILDKLKDAALTIGVATSGQLKELIVELLKRRHIYHFISAIVSRDDIPEPKPSPKSIQECLRLLEASPEESVYVGDSVVDIQASRAAGTRSIAVLSGAGSYETLSREKPDHIIRDVRELVKILYLPNDKN